MFRRKTGGSVHVSGGGLQVEGRTLVWTRTLSTWLLLCGLMGFWRQVCRMKNEAFGKVYRVEVVRKYISHPDNYDLRGWLGVKTNDLSIYLSERYWGPEPFTDLSITKPFYSRSLFLFYRESVQSMKMGTCDVVELGRSIHEPGSVVLNCLKPVKKVCQTNSHSTHLQVQP